MTPDSTNSTPDVSLDTQALRWLLEMPPEGRAHVLRALAHCSEEVQQSLIELIEVAESPDSTEQDKASARATIQETLQSYGHPKARGVSLRGLEAGAVGQSRQVDQTSQPVESQEEQFARKLWASMKAKGLTQVELASRSDCTQPAISQMLSRRCRPQKRTILKLAEALGVAPTDLWPDLEVAEILDTVAAVQTDDEQLSPEEAAAIERAMDRKPTGPPGKGLPRFKR
jgi:transcriptional regulator with XRE-family HTH domain